MLTEAERYTVRSGGPGDAGAVLAAYRRCTGSAPSPEEWAWTFERNPAGSRARLVVDGGGRVVAHFATRASRVVVDGEERAFGQVAGAFVDTDVDPDPHAPWLLVEAARELLGEAGPDGDLVSYARSGPDDWAAWEVQRRHLRFEFLRMQPRLERAVGPARPGLPLRVGSLEVDVSRGLASGPRDEVRELFDRASEPLLASTLRDSAFLRWRFLEHPSRDYDLLAVRDAGGALLGYAAGRIRADGRSSSFAIVDWLVPQEDRAAGRALVAGILTHAGARNATTVEASFPEWSPWFEFFQEEGFLATPTDYLTAIRRHHPRHEVYFLRDHWWYQPADFAEA